MRASIFNNSTGQILRLVTSLADSMGIQLATDENWIEGHYADDQFYIHELTPVAMEQRPSTNHVFNYVTKSWELDAGTLTASALSKRAQLLQSSDWTQLPDVPLATKDAWATYRQALRDITSQTGYPLDVVWPVAP